MSSILIKDVTVEDLFEAVASLNGNLSQIQLRNTNVGTLASNSIDIYSSNASSVEFMGSRFVFEHIDKTAGSEKTNFKLWQRLNGTLVSRLYIDQTGMGFGINGSITTIPANKRFVIADSAAPTFTSVGNGLGASFANGGGFYMKDTVTGLEAKMESYAGTNRIGMANIGVWFPITFWSEGASETMRLNSNGNLLINRKTDYNTGYKCSVDGNMWVRDNSYARDYFEDFLMGSLTATTNPLSFVGGTANGGTSTLDTTVPTDSSFEGRVQIATGTTNNSTGRSWLNAHNSVNRFIPVCGSKSFITFEWRVRLPVLSGTPSFRLLCGITDASSSTSAVTNGIYFTYTNSTNSGAWVCNTTSSSTTTTINTNLTIVANTWYKLKVDILNDNTIDFYINETYYGSSTTNRPTVACRPISIIEKTSSSTTSRLADLDYFYMRSER